MVIKYRRRRRPFRRVYRRRRRRIHRPNGCGPDAKQFVKLRSQIFIASDTSGNATRTFPDDPADSTDWNHIANLFSVL